MAAITVASLNLWGQTGDLRARMAYAAKDLRRHHVDVLLLQEADGGEGLADALGMKFFVGTQGAEGFRLAIASTLPHLELRESALPSPDGEMRTILSLQLGSAWVHTTHLSHHLAASAWRQKQVRAIDELLAGLAGVQILGGDMNADPESDEMRFLRGLCTIDGRSTHMQDAWLRHHREGPAAATWSTERGAQRAMRSVDVDRRIDYLYVSTRQKSGVGTVLASGLCCEVASEQGLVASDHRGVWAKVAIGE